MSVKSSGIYIALDLAFFGQRPSTKVIARTAWVRALRCCMITRVRVYRMYPYSCLLHWLRLLPPSKEVMRTKRGLHSRVLGAPHIALTVAMWNLPHASRGRLVTFGELASPSSAASACRSQVLDGLERDWLANVA